jgi:hypothetical protein
MFQCFFIFSLFILELNVVIEAARTIMNIIQSNQAHAWIMWHTHTWLHNTQIKDFLTSFTFHNTLTDYFVCSFTNTLNLSIIPFDSYYGVCFMPVPKDCYCPVLYLHLPNIGPFWCLCHPIPIHAVQILSFLLLKNNIVNFIMIEQCRCSG